VAQVVSDAEGLIGGDPAIADGAAYSAMAGLSDGRSAHGPSNDLIFN
jgi:hypothetical protein